MVLDGLGKLAEWDLTVAVKMFDSWHMVWKLPEHRMEVV